VGEDDRSLAGIKNKKGEFMNILYKVRNWGDIHHPKVLDVIRMLLGILLFLKGVQFFNNAPYLRYLIIENKIIQQSPDLIAFLIGYVTYVHLVGGILVFVGLFTRLAALLQIPVVFGAVFFVNILSSYVNSELWLSVLVLALLFLFVIMGSGPFSLDRALLKSKDW
jgi:putative oxidoreductase